MQRKIPADVSIHSESEKEGMTATKYIRYGLAIKCLRERLHATPEELAAWVFYGNKKGGLNAYANAHELDPPPRFFFEPEMGWDYLHPLQGCWFLKTDVESFHPEDRFITGTALIERWSHDPDLEPTQFITHMVQESRLMDVHPITGLTQAHGSESEGFPPIEQGLFPLHQVEKIEMDEGFQGLQKKASKHERAGNSLTSLNESPTERINRLQERKNQLQAQGVRAWRKELAKEENLSESRVYQILNPSENNKRPVSSTRGWGIKIP
jgi:hypothetical protein